MRVNFYTSKLQMIYDTPDEFAACSWDHHVDLYFSILDYGFNSPMRVDSTVEELLWRLVNVNGNQH